jgi:hypothetical protein
MSGVVEAWLLTLAAEVPLVALVYPGQRTRMAAACALGTTVTNLAMNLALPRWLGAGAAFLVVGEAGALLLEAALYARVGRPRDLARALVASALANGASFAAGLMLFPYPT